LSDHLQTGAPWVIAHRGASREAPENTLAAFDEALRQGCDAIECDVQLSRDGVPVVYHDRTLTRAGGGRRRVARLAVDELTRLDPGRRFDRCFEGEHIPTLEAVLERYARRTRLLVEIKTREGCARLERHLELASAVADLVRNLRSEKLVALLCFDGDVLSHLERVAPSIPRVVNLKPPRRLSPALRARLGSLAAVSADVRALTTAFGRDLQDAGCPLMVYTCNTTARVRRALGAGAMGVMSDRPRWLAGVLRAEVHA
jgi:glycerophosphoryl diester phosphodiesterase